MFKTSQLKLQITKLISISISRAQTSGAPNKQTGVFSGFACWPQTAENIQKTVLTVTQYQYREQNYSKNLRYLLIMSINLSVFRQQMCVQRINFPCDSAGCLRLSHSVLF